MGSGFGDGGLTAIETARIIFDAICAGRPVTDLQRLELLAFIYGK